MSRSGYDDECNGWDLIRWRGAVASAMNGHRGQRLLSELLAAMDAMPSKRLIKYELVREGSYCALGVVGAARGIDMESIDPDQSDQVSMAFDIAEAMAKEIVWVNDEAGWNETPEQRWIRVRKWVGDHINQPQHDA